MICSLLCKSSTCWVLYSFQLFHVMQIRATGRDVDCEARVICIPSWKEDDFWWHFGHDHRNDILYFVISFEWSCIYIWCKDFIEMYFETSFHLKENFKFRCYFIKLGRGVTYLSVFFRRKFESVSKLNWFVLKLGLESRF